MSKLFFARFGWIGNILALSRFTLKCFKISHGSYKLLRKKKALK